MGFFKHPSAIVESDSIGEGTRIWAFAHVLKGAVIGRNCNISDHCYLESGVTIGDDVTIKNGVALWEGVTIQRGVFVGPYVVLTNDLVPRSRAKDWRLLPTVIEEGATVGANATLLCGIKIGAYSMVGAGSVVTTDVRQHGLVYGNPARIHGYVCRCGGRLRLAGRKAACAKCGLSYVRDGGSFLLTEEKKRRA